MDSNIHRYTGGHSVGSRHLRNCACVCMCGVGVALCIIMLMYVVAHNVCVHM